MTNEQERRLKQIRERLEMWQDTMDFVKPTPQDFKELAQDCTALLSLVDGQVAVRPFGWVSCGLRNGNDRIVDIVFENADCAKAFIDNVEPVDGPIVIADSMRSACIEKVAALRDRNSTSEYAMYWLRKAIEEIEATTIQEQEKQ